MQKEDRGKHLRRPFEDDGYWVCRGSGKGETVKVCGIRGCIVDESEYEMRNWCCPSW